jgi:hypothetical protein
VAARLDLQGVVFVDIVLPVERIAGGDLREAADGLVMPAGEVIDDLFDAPRPARARRVPPVGRDGLEQSQETA